MNADERKHIETAQKLYADVVPTLRPYKHCSENIAEALHVLDTLAETLEVAFADAQIEHDAEQEVFAREHRKEIEFKTGWILPA